MKHSPPKLKVALLGCGQIADAHLSQIKRVDCADVVAVCDVLEFNRENLQTPAGYPARFLNHIREF
ncbi:hypothetical protein OAF74_01205 [bacterium]|nr:hypothetical protein [bacterium]MDB4731432.1 hypothetical protein [bacterium]